MEKKDSRTNNATRNAMTGAMTQVLGVLIEFVTRTIFIKILGSEYLGVNGLFTNILTVLSFAELGIGEAIIFNLYKAIADNDEKKIKSLLNLYKKAYTYIGIIVLILGLCITPMIELFIESTPNIKENIHCIFILFLLNTVTTYFFAYKKSIILAKQKGYILNICKLLTTVAKSILQIVFLILTKNFIIYLLIMITSSLIDNIVSFIISDKMFGNYKAGAEQLSKQEKKSIFANVKSLVLYKFSFVVLSGTDNIIVSKMLGLKMVGLLSNFHLLINTVITVLGNALNGFTASIGNLNAKSSTENQESVFKELFMFCVWLYGLCAIMCLILVRPFVVIWLGEEYLLSIATVVALIFNMYISGIQFTGYTFRTTLGLFTKGRYIPVLTAALNIVLSIILCKYIGMTGIILATAISRLVTTTWYDIYAVHKYGFNTSPINSYIKYIYYFIIFVINATTCYFAINLIGIGGILGFVLKATLSAILPNVIFALFFHKLEEYNKLKNRLKGIFFKKFGKLFLKKEHKNG